MKKMAGPIVASLALTALTACGGGSGGGGSSLSSDAVKYNSLVDEYNGQINKYKINNVPLRDIKGTPIAQMPSNGKATYTGIGQVSNNSLRALNRENIALGEARLTADFADGTLTGNVTNFKTNRGNSTSGQLSVDSVIIGNNLIGKTEGSIVLDGTRHMINHPNGGVFLGNSAKAVQILSTDKANQFDIDSIDTSILAEKK